MKSLIVQFDNDPDIDDPSELDGEWKLYSFCARHKAFKSPDELNVVASRNGPISVDDPELATKLEHGLAFWLSYFEHGDSVWLRADGPIPAGVEFKWDGVRCAGLLVWEHPAGDLGPKTKEDRAKDADAFLVHYTAWANGRGLCYIIGTRDTPVISAAGGFCTDDAAIAAAVGDLDTRDLLDAEITVKGEAVYLIDDFLRAVAKAKRPPGLPWQPIETAPKDRSVLLWFPTMYSHPVARVGYYQDDRHAKKPKPYWQAKGEDVSTCRKHSPTHWCEITPPKT